jgi:hypothetical protein
VWRGADDLFHATTLDFTKMNTVDGLEQLWDYINKVMTADDTMVLESFEFRKEDTGREYINYSTGEYVGVCKLGAILKGMYLIVQNSATGKGFWNDDKLKRAGVYGICDSRHSRDAMRHWLKYWTFNRNDKEFLFKLK